MGGSAAAWGSDSDVFDAEVWQGTVGVAERLWVGGTVPKHGPPGESADVNSSARVHAGADANSDGTVRDGAENDGAQGGFNVTAALPRLATHVCRMRSRGFAVAQYRPSTLGLSGATAWCTGGVHGEPVENGNICAACPAEWNWPPIA